MRHEQRIDIFLKALGDEWKRQSPDLRFGQFLMNNGVFNQDIFHLEEYDFIEEFFPKIPKRDYYIWGSRGKDGKQPLKLNALKNLETDHIEAILRTQKNISDSYTIVLKEELLLRRKIKLKKLLDN